MSTTDEGLDANPFDTLALSVARRLGVLPVADAPIDRLPGAGRGAPAYWGKVLVVSSASAGEGKSFVVGRLARRLSVAGAAQVAVVDANAAHPSLHHCFKVPATGFGLFDCIAAGRVIDAQWACSPLNRVEVLAMRGGARASMLMRVAAVNRVLDGLRSRFAVTIIDAGVLGRTGCLTQLADATLIVVDAARTRRESVARALAGTHVDRERVIGVVLNRRPTYVPEWLLRRVA